MPGLVATKLELLNKWACQLCCAGAQAPYKARETLETYFRCCLIATLLQALLPVRVQVQGCRQAGVTSITTAET
jgi:hypothetical protein